MESNIQRDGKSTKIIRIKPKFTVQGVRFYGLYLKTFESTELGRIKKARFKQRAINPENYHDELVLADDEQQMFDMVYDEYNRFSAVALMNMTHTEGPWKNHCIGDVITNDELRTFFLTQIDRDEPFQTDEHGRIILTANMRDAVYKAERSMAEGTCLTEEMFQTRFAKWL